MVLIISYTLLPGSLSSDIIHSNKQYWEPDGSGLSGRQLSPIMKHFIQALKQLTPLSTKISPKINGDTVNNIIRWIKFVLMVISWICNKHKKRKLLFTVACLSETVVHWSDGSRVSDFYMGEACHHPSFPFLTDLFSPYILNLGGESLRNLF